MYIQDFQLEVNVLVFDCYKISAPLRLYCFLGCTIVSVSSSFLMLFGVHNHWYDRYYRLFFQNIDFQVMQGYSVEQLTTKDKVSTQAKRSSPARAHPSFHSIKQLGASPAPPGWDASPLQGYCQHFFRLP